MVMLMSQSNLHLLLLYVVVPSLDVLLFNIIGSSPTWFVSEKKKVLQETPFGGVKPSPGSTNQRTQQVAINKATETCATMQNGRMAQVLSGRPKAKESSWTTRETRGAGAPFPHTKDAITDGKIFRTWHQITIAAPSYTTLST